ncbi:MAG: SMC family ATPase [Anaerolineae bacterium]|nr:SMC family ATPase [Anaerolineae bacterium]
MRPVRLELHNFLAYRDPAPLSFDGLDVACLSGPNGAGKSSLLDAITWALWGRSRAPGNRADDMLIYLGQTEMWVQFDFRQEEMIFRVRREYKRGKTNQSALQFYVWHGDQQQWESLTESLRETQDKINALLRLDYSTFVESAFVQQGKADSFTQKSPSERKTLLGTILGLARWEAYERAAKAEIDKLTIDLHSKDGAIQEIASRDGDEAVLQERLLAAKAALQANQQDREAAQQAYHEIATAPQQKADAEKQHKSVQQRIQQAERDLKATQDNLSKQQTSYQNFSRILQRQQEITSCYAELDQARQVDSAQGALLGKLSNLERQHSALEKELAKKRSELEAQQRVHLDRASAAERLSTELPILVQQAQRLDADFTKIEALEEDRKALQEQDKRFQREITELTTQNNTITEQGLAIKQRRETMEKSDICPLCGQPIDEHHRRSHIEELTTEREVLLLKWKENSTRINELEQTVKDNHIGIAEIETRLKGFDKLKSDRGRLHERIAKAEQAAAEVEHERALAAQLEAQLESGNYGGDLPQRLQQIEAEIMEMGYDGELHESARQVIGELAGYEAQFRDLQVAQTVITEVRTNIDTLTTQIEGQRVALQQERDSLAALVNSIGELTARVQESEKRRLRLNELHQLENSAREAFARVEQQISALVVERQRRQELESEREKINREIKLYTELREAFGKNGVPAMIIESAIPELEESANRLLTRMTDGRMSIRFDTQRSTKGGDTIETLDILISDELGQRSYDMFSGGEGFRINFALRIALSQLLARRAGARLQTLVIDEGFGSQDSVGRERVVEAINAIRGDFDLILIVTHIDELLELFPARIEVSKTETGSHAIIR